MSRLRVLILFLLSLASQAKHEPLLEHKGEQHAPSEQKGLSSLSVAALLGCLGIGTWFMYSYSSSQLTPCQQHLLDLTSEKHFNSHVEFLNSYIKPCRFLVKQVKNIPLKMRMCRNIVTDIDSYNSQQGVIRDKLRNLLTLTSMQELEDIIQREHGDVPTDNSSLFMSHIASYLNENPDLLFQNLHGTEISLLAHLINKIKLTRRIRPISHNITTHELFKLFQQHNAPLLIPNEDGYLNGTGLLWNHTSSQWDSRIKWHEDPSWLAILDYFHHEITPKIANEIHPTKNISLLTSCIIESPSDATTHHVFQFLLKQGANPDTKSLLDLSSFLRPLTGDENQSNEPKWLSFVDIATTLKVAADKYLVSKSKALAKEAQARYYQNIWHELQTFLQKDKGFVMLKNARSYRLTDIAITS